MRYHGYLLTRPFGIRFLFSQEDRQSTGTREPLAYNRL
uniref:Uncharacterized protein n=1 Tax=Picea glauca TaxID=3330 RepID=A0A117NI14_PICGL|nr:hypothetical protein ABT39_MTgene3815 [Picea glauca]